MSKLDVLHCSLLKRLSAVIREIFEEVEATVKDYREETLRTQTENATLKQQLRDVLIRTEAHLNGQVHHVSQHVPDKVMPTAGGSGSQKETEDREMEDYDESPDSFSGEKPCLRDYISICKTESEDREVVQLKENSSIVPLSSTGEQWLVPQSGDERWKAGLPSVETDGIKTEQEDTIITITSSVVTAPAHESQCQGSENTHQITKVCDASATLIKAQRKDLHCTLRSKPRKVSTNTVDDLLNEGPYTCNKCGRQLKDLMKLQLHKKLHERSFSCHWCGRNFSKYDYLRMHMRTHTGERPYRCKWCSKTFTQCGNMRRHERTCQRSAEEATVYLQDNRPLLTL